jgi:hypothetical protein
MTNAKPSLVKPTLETPYHIDFSWWRQSDREWQVYLRSLLGPEKEDLLDSLEGDEMVDWVDPVTAEVHQVDAIQYLLMTHFAEDEELAGEGTSLVEGLFRTFLRNGNEPMNAEQLGAALDRPAVTILRTLSGARVYRGIRPVAAASKS